MWALDYQFDQTTDGRVVKLLNVVDEHTREALTITVGRRLKDLEAENARLKPIVADKELQIQALEGAGRGTWCARPAGAARSSTCSGCSGCRSGGRASWSGSTAAPSVTSPSSRTGIGRCVNNSAGSAGPILGGAIGAPTPSS